LIKSQPTIYMSCYVTCHVTTHLEALVGHPHRAVALEATAKAELPDLVGLADALEGLNVRQHIPAGFGRTAQHRVKGTTQGVVT
jgi:hypothetical protein